MEIKFLKFISLLFIIGALSFKIQAQYIERPEIIHFHGVWVSTDQVYDSILLELTAKKNFPIKTGQWDSGVSTDVLLMNIRSYIDGEIVYQINNLEEKHQNQYFVAFMAHPDEETGTSFKFQYGDYEDTIVGSSGNGTLRYHNGKLHMEIGKMINTERKSPKEDKNVEGNPYSIISVPHSLSFVKKAMVMFNQPNSTGI